MDQFVQAGAIAHRIRIDGDRGPWVVFSNSLGCRLEMWNEQAAALAGKHRVLRYDTRGHGGTESTPGPYSFEQLSDDLFDVMDAVGVPTAAFVGLSMGGMLGQVAAVREPARFSAHLFADTTSAYGPAVADFWARRARMALDGKLEDIAETTPARWFTPSFVSAKPQVVAYYQAMVRETSPQGYAGCCYAIRDINITSRLAEITAPTAVVVGADDPSTTVEHARVIDSAIPHSRLHIIPNAAHLSNVEQGDAFNRVLVTLLKEISR